MKMTVEQIIEKLKNDNKYICYVRKELKNDADFAKLILLINPDFYKDLSEELKSSEEIAKFLFENYSIEYLYESGVYNKVAVRHKELVAPGTEIYDEINKVKINYCRKRFYNMVNELGSEKRR